MSIYLDNAASTCPKPASVIEAVEKCLKVYCANPGRGAHKTAVEAARIINRARQKAAGFLGVDKSSNLIFTQNATDALNMAMRGFLSSGDHVITSTVEHNAVARPLYSLEREGVDVSRVPADKAGRLDIEKITGEVRSNTKLAVFTHVSNVTAAIQPIEEIGAALKDKGVALLIDAAQSAGVVPLDMGRMSVDMLACTGHKSLMGPQGIGLLYISPDIELRSTRQGGTGSHSEEKLQDTLARPDRYESGTLNAPGIAGLGAGIEFIESEGLENLGRQKTRLAGKLQQGLLAIDNVEVYGPALGEERAPLVAFNIGVLSSTETASLLDSEFDIASRAGLHCAPGAHMAMGTLDRGVVRLSLGPFNSEEDVEAAINAVSEIAGKA